MKHFPLARQAGRVALLLGVLDQTVTEKEIRAAVVNDTLPRPRTKPVVAAGRRYSSLKAAAEGLVARKHELAMDAMFRYGPTDRMLKAVERAISYRATKDDVRGFYWA